LTPSYLYPEDAIHFHQTHKNICDSFDQTWYGSFKKWCDSYFLIRHRNECRGIGGIFFDDLCDGNRNDLLKFLTACGEGFSKAFMPIVLSRKNQKFNESQKHWQQLRRGRYVEFNLIWDRGTKFGLHTPNARIESILMSLPLTSRWEYMHHPETGTAEAQLVEVLQHPVDWV